MAQKRIQRLIKFHMQYKTGAYAPVLYSWVVMDERLDWVEICLIVY
jgi:hypothetical protein